jgi:hypothetical protein
VGIAPVALRGLATMTAREVILAALLGELSCTERAPSARDTADLGGRAEDLALQRTDLGGLARDLARTSRSAPIWPSRSTLPRACPILRAPWAAGGANACVS